MYPAQWATPDRIHTVEEALMFPVREKTDADLYLYILDTYDVLLSGVEGQIPVSSNMCEKLREHIADAVVFRYEELKNRIVGRLKGWTNAMLLYVCASLAGIQGTSHHVIPPDMREWMKRERLRVTNSYDCLDWTYTDLLASLECIESKWKTNASWGPFIADYLRIHEHCIDNFISRSSPLFLIDYAPDRAGKDPYSLKPTAIHGLISRIVSLRRSLGVRSMFKVRPRKLPENHQWHKFADKEARHLTTRAFRTNVSAMVWKCNLRPSDSDRAEYARKAAVSHFGCISKERSLDYVDNVNEIVTYKDAPDILRDARTADGLALSMVHAMFMGTYNVPFKDYFVVYEEKLLKHKKAIMTAPVPLIVERSGRWDACYKGVLYESEPETKTNDGDGEGIERGSYPLSTFPRAFVLWSVLCRVELSGVLFGSMDVRLVVSQVLDVAEVRVNRVVRGTISY